MDTCFDKVKTGNPFKNNKAEFEKAIAKYNQRDRRFGGVKEEPANV